MEKLRVLSLFAGVGGLDLGLERTGGFRTVAVAEVDPYASRVLALRFPDVPNVGDVTTAEYPDADVICADFPCQDLSYAGAGAGLAGARSGLFWEVVRAARLVRPRLIILENVAALLGRGLDVVLRALAEIGYDAEWHCIPASAVGAPHRRDRIWIIAHARGEQHEGGRTPLSGALAEELSRAVADAPCELPHGGGAARNGRNEPANVGEALAYAPSIGQPKSGQPVERSRPEADGEGQATYAVAGCLGNIWRAEPDVGRVAHGVPPELDGGLSGKELDQAASPKGVPSPRKVRGVRRNRKAGEAPPVIQRAGAGGDTLPPLPCEGRPARRAPEDQATEGLCPLRSGIHAETQQEAHALQRGMQVDRWPHERDEALASVWSEEPGVPRVAQGVKHRVDRLRCLGNAVVPQIPELIGNAILAAHREASRDAA